MDNFVALSKSIEKPSLRLNPSPTVATPARDQIDADALLQISRRVDWRFLLPQPNLGRVAYLGPADGSLLAALQLFSESLTVIDSSRSTSVGQFEVVVVAEPSADRLAQAADRLCPGGWLYVEAFGPAHPRQLKAYLTGQFKRQSWPLLTPANCAAVLTRLALTDVQTHWHWPDFETCTQITPLDEPALAYSLGQRRSHSARAQFRAAFGRSLWRSGLLLKIMPCFSLVAQRPQVVAQQS
jgi:hypothetical protein